MNTLKIVPVFLFLLVSIVSSEQQCGGKIYCPSSPSGCCLADQQCCNNICCSFDEICCGGSANNLRLPRTPSEPTGCEATRGAMPRAPEGRSCCLPLTENSIDTNDTNGTITTNSTVFHSSVPDAYNSGFIAIFILVMLLPIFF